MDRGDQEYRERVDELVDAMDVTSVDALAYHAHISVALVLQDVFEEARNRLGLTRR